MFFTFRCRDCDQELYVDDENVSEIGKKIPLEYDDYHQEETGEPHNCRFKPPWTSEPFECDDCGESLYVSDAHLSKKRGRRIPMNEDDDKPHRCQERDHSLPCKWCNQRIEVLDDIVSESGKRIPLDAGTIVTDEYDSSSTGTTHRCLKKSPSPSPSTKTSSTVAR
jgi:hypothetical protein